MRHPRGERLSPGVALPLARAAWMAAQGLAAPAAGEVDVASLVANTGWLRTLGGAEAYLAVNARAPGLSVATVNTSLASGALRALPSARGCLYALPGAHAGLALRFAASLARKRTVRDLEKVGVDAVEQAQVAAAVVAALAAGPLGTDGLRAALKGQLRSLGELGTKHGIASPLPPVVRLLEFDGRVARRIAAGLDEDRYLWSLPDADVFAGTPDEDDAVGLAAALLRVWLPHAGPATLDEFAEWSGAGKRDCRAAAERVGVEWWEVEELGPAMVLAGTPIPAAPVPEDHVVFLGSLDNYTANRAAARFMVAREDWSRRTTNFGARGEPPTFADARWASQRHIVRGGVIVGTWEYDPDAQIVRWGTWRTHDRLPEMQAHAERVGALLRDEVGHGLVFSLDSAAEQRKRLATIPP